MAQFYNAPTARRVNFTLLDGFFCYLWLVTSCYACYNAFVRNSWVIGDWLINYEGGFVRRGLIGQGIYTLSYFLRINGAWLAALLQVALYTVIFLCTRYFLKRQAWNLWLLLLTVSPATLSFQIVEHWGGFRKELMYLAAFSLFAVMLDAKKLKDTYISAYLSIVFALCILSHEMTLCYTPYYFAALMLDFRHLGRCIRIFIIPACVALLTFAIVSLHTGNADIVEKICLSLGSHMSDQTGICSGAINYLAMSKEYAFGRVTFSFINYRYYILYPLVLILSLFPIVMLMRHYYVRCHLKAEIKIVLTAALSAFFLTIPLFTYGTDWGRWIYIHIISLFFLLLLVGKQEASNMPVKTKRMLMLAFLVMYACCWSIPTCCTDSLGTGYLHYANTVFQRLIAGDKRH